MTMASASHLIDHPELAEIFVKDLEGTPLTPAERVRVMARVYASMRHFENVHYQYLTGMLSADEWAGFRLNLKGLLETGTYVEYWGNESQLYSQAFQAEVGRVQQELADATAAAARGDVDADLGHAAVDAAVRDRAQGRPADDLAVEASHQAAVGQVAGVPLGPLRRRGLEARLARSQALRVDLAHPRPVGRRHRVDAHGDGV